MVTVTRQETIAAIWSGLQQIGVPPGNVITWDRATGHKGYEGGEGVQLEFSAEHVCKVCSEWAHVLINVPSFKSHWLSGIAVCLKNWVGAVDALDIQDRNTPWPFHADSCANLGMIAARPEIRDKLKVNIVDALQLLFEGGPQINPQYLWNYGGLIVGTDQVAVDRVCLDILQQKRNEFKGGEWPISPPPQHIMVAAEKYGLGVADLAQIDVVTL